MEKHTTGVSINTMKKSYLLSAFVLMSLLSPARDITSPPSVVRECCFPAYEKPPNSNQICRRYCHVPGPPPGGGGCIGAGTELSVWYEGDCERCKISQHSLCSDDCVDYTVEHPTSVWICVIDSICPSCDPCVIEIKCRWEDTGDDEFPEVPDCVADGVVSCLDLPQ